MTEKAAKGDLAQVLKPSIFTVARRLPASALALLLLLTLALPAKAQMGSTLEAKKDVPSALTGQVSGQGESPSDILSTLNHEFRSVYQREKERSSKEAKPLIICIGDHMVLIDESVREQVNFIPPKYTQLKVVDHVPLVLFVLLNSKCDMPLDDQTREELDKIKQLVARARPAMATLGLDGPTLARQHQLLDLSVSFLEQVQKQGKVSKKQLVTFCRDLEPMIMKNVDQAVASQLEIMDKTTSGWREKLGPERFKKLTVLIVSSHMPRERHTCFQYFSRALHVKREGLKIVYSEGPEEEKAALDLLGTHVLDATIGETFFKEKLRMHRDLLSDGAARYLNAHPPLSHQTKAQ